MVQDCFEKGVYNLPVDGHESHADAREQDLTQLE
jgi:hypothetical protein